MDHGLILKDVQRVIKFWEWVLQAEEQFSVWEDYGNVRKHRDVKRVLNETKMSHLVSEPSYHTRTWFLEKLLVKEMNETDVKMNCLV